jgi:very-short-patch-repair endonuclease
VPIGRYIVDFYCPELRLAIELDGAHHGTSWMSEYDGQRSLDLRKRGIRVLRIPNELLVRDSLLVGDQIHAAIVELAEARHPMAGEER